MNEVDGIVKMMEEEDASALVGKGTMLRNLVMQLRKICLHPYLFGEERFLELLLHSFALECTPQSVFFIRPSLRLRGTKHERNYCGGAHRILR
jgi:hypothetical protein